MRSRNSRRMTYTKFDVLKLCALVSLFAILAYSALTKFVFVPSVAGNLHVETDYRPCDSISNCVSCKDRTTSVGLCRSEVSSAFAIANEKCKGYLHNLTACRRGQRSPCRIETANVEGCFSSVTGKTMQKWLDVSRNTNGVRDNDVQHQS